MNKKSFIERFDNIKNPICDKYGAYLYFLISDIFNVSEIEDICEKLGYTSKRRGSFPVMSDLYFEDKLIGVINNQGFPNIEFWKKNKKHATIISKNSSVIAPIEGCHRILNWHTVKDKLHILAGGEIVLHFLPVEISDDDIIKFLTKVKLIDRVEEFKEREKK